MDYKKNVKAMGEIKNKILSDKKFLYSIIAVIIFLLFYAIFVRSFIKKQEEEKNLKNKQVKEEQIKIRQEEKLKNANFSRITFFLVSPIRASLAMPDYLEGNYRLKEDGSKATFSYIKNPDSPTPFFYLRYAEKENEKLTEGEKKIQEIKSGKDSKTYSLIYYIYPEDSYVGPEKEGFKEVLWDVENAIIGSLKVF